MFIYCILSDFSNKSRSLKLSFSVAGFNPNVQDIAPRYAGVVYGISNTISNTPGFLSPQIAGWILGEGVVSMAI